MMKMFHVPKMRRESQRNNFRASVLQVGEDILDLCKEIVRGC